METSTFYPLEADAFQETQKNGPANWSYHVLHEPVTPSLMSFCQFSSLRLVINFGFNTLSWGSAGGSARYNKA